jgi:hypothetical protein
MSKNEALLQLTERPRAMLAKENLRALERIFWENARSGIDRADLIDDILRESGEERYEKALSLLEEMPQATESYFAKTEFSSSKIKLWTVLLDNWFEFRRDESREKDEKIGNYILRITARVHLDSNCQEFDKLLRKKLEHWGDGQVRQFLPKLQRVLGHAAVGINKDKPYRLEVIQLLAHACIRYGNTEAILERFKKT